MEAIQSSGNTAIADSRSTPAIRVLVVDDHPSFRSAVADLIAEAPDFVLVGQAASGEEALGKVQRLTPQLILMDVVMPGIGGIAAARTVLSEYPEVAILLVSVDDPECYLETNDHSERIACLRKQDLSPGVLSRAWNALHG